MEEPGLTEPGLRDGHTADVVCAKRDAVIAGVAAAVFLQVNCVTIGCKLITSSDMANCDKHRETGNQGNLC